MDDLSDRLRRHVDVQSELTGGRNSKHPAALGATRTYIRREPAAMGHTVVGQPFVFHDRAAVKLEVPLPGRGPRGSTLVIGAHYDSAVTIPLEIGRSLAGRQPSRRVPIVFFHCEEPSYFNKRQMGSQHHTALLRQQSGERVLGMICLESLGYYPPFDRETPAKLPVPRSWFNRLLGLRHVVIVSNLRSVGFGLPFVYRFATSGTFPFLPAALPARWVPEITGVRSGREQ